MVYITDCANCIHQGSLIDGWRSCCDAFPNGRPFDFDYSKVKEIKECNNGIGYEPKEKDCS